MNTIDKLLNYIPKNWQQLLPWGIVGLAGILVLIIFATQIKALIFDDEDQSFNSSQATQQERLKLKPSIANMHLFGNKYIAEVLRTSSKYKLSGIFLAQDPDFSTAVIAVDKKEENLYGINDALPGGAKVKVIRQHEVIIERSGKREKLVLDINDPRKAGVGRSNRSGSGYQGLSPKQIQGIKERYKNKKSHRSRNLMSNPKNRERMKKLLEERGIDEGSLKRYLQEL